MAVQRFEGHEHESLGNVTGAEVDVGNGVVLTWGQVVALAGDHFGTLRDLRKATETEEGRYRIRAAIEHAGLKDPIPASLPDPAADPEKAAKAKEAQKKEYQTLLLTNVAHFAGGGDALVSWQSHHTDALERALTAGLTGDDALFQEAQAFEAFGQHYLTDMFSAGHVRTPRKEVISFYSDKASDMSAALMKNLRARVESALVAQAMSQIPPMLRGNLAQAKIAEMVRETVDAEINAKLAEIGGQEGFAELFGLALAGAVSGAMHDSEGREGLVVTSEAHPEPWLAKGDAMLDESEPAGVSRDQAEQAVLAGREQLLAARHLGQREAEIESRIPEAPPAVVYFAFDSSALDGSAKSAALAAGAYLHSHPDSYVELIGHADPLGGHAYNMALGQRRAQAVLDLMVEGGAQPHQVVASSQGEGSLVTSDPKRYEENRRVELQWHNTPMSSEEAAPEQSGEATDPARARARAALEALGPPYTAVERFIPQPVAEMNEPLPEWRWGQMSPKLVAELDKWMQKYLKDETKAITDAIPETVTKHKPPLDPITVTPRRFVEQVVNELMRSPSRTLGNLIGEQPGG